MCAPHRRAVETARIASRPRRAGMTALVSRFAILLEPERTHDPHAWTHRRNHRGHRHLRVRQEAKNRHRDRGRRRRSYRHRDRRRRRARSSILAAPPRGWRNRLLGAQLEVEAKSAAARELDAPVRGLQARGQIASVKIYDGRDEQEPVDAIEHAAVTREQASGVFDTEGPLHQGLHEISELSARASQGA